MCEDRAHAEELAAAVQKTIQAQVLAGRYRAGLERIQREGDDHARQIAAEALSTSVDVAVRLCSPSDCLRARCDG